MVVFCDTVHINCVDIEYTSRMYKACGGGGAVVEIHGRQTRLILTDTRRANTVRSLLYPTNNIGYFAGLIFRSIKRVVN